MVIEDGLSHESCRKCAASSPSSGKIRRAHCIDGKPIKELFGMNGFVCSEKPARKEYGCTESVDIGAYDTFPHGCVYCYANINKKIAEARFQNHERKK
ncbi:MAG: DUF1848 domain-containing protein [Candidatus Methanoperedens sp.]|nr:DUF1848 domain-containing protein [Candidatus Methanoperedens sp.]